MTAATTPDISRFCSTCARSAGLDAAGSAYTYEHVLAAEIPLPWPITMYDTPGVLPQELLEFRRVLIESYQQGKPLSVGSLAIAPDPAYSVPGHRRVISYRRPEGLFARYTQQEYVVPEAQFGPLCWALLVEPANLPQYEQFMQPASETRDLLVCTHGAVDAACAKFGFPIYRQLRSIADASDGRIRAWRVSHFGGHVFAPTVIEMPDFRYWGYVDKGEAERLVHRAGEASAMRQCVRGWAGFESPFLQTAERELFVRHGWEWLDYLKHGTLLDEAQAGDGDVDTASWADVRIDFKTPDGAERGAYVARVETSSHIETFHTTGEAGTYRYPQYSVTRLERVE